MNTDKRPYVVVALIACFVSWVLIAFAFRKTDNATVFEAWKKQTGNPNGLTPAEFELLRKEKILK